MEEAIEDFYYQGILRIKDLGEEISKDNASREEKLWIAVLNRLKSKIDKEMDSENLSADESFVLTQINHSIEGLVSMYISVKYGQYRAANRDMRFALESHILADYSIEDKEWAKERAEDLLEEGREQNEGIEKEFPFANTTSKISNKASELRDKIRSDVEGMNNYYNWISVMGSHPYSVVYSDGFEEAEDKLMKELQSLGMQLTAANTILFYSKFANVEEMERNYWLLTSMFSELFSEIDNSLMAFLCYHTDVEKVTNPQDN
jgi:hypothetical protein